MDFTKNSKWFYCDYLFIYFIVFNEFTHLEQFKSSQEELQWAQVLITLLLLTLVGSSAPHSSLHIPCQHGEGENQKGRSKKYCGLR